MKKARTPICLFCILALWAFYLIRKGETQLDQLREQNKERMERLIESNQQQEKKDPEEHKKEMADKDLISGNRALEAHEQEWKKRSEYDPAFARTTREKTILQISSLAKDKSLPAKDLLQKVAVLAAPRNSKVVVTPNENSFQIAVSFDMSVMTSGEEGSRTKHTTIESLKREAIEIISRVARDMYDHCGQKEIESIGVACTHGVKQSQFGIPSSTSHTITTTIYKCAISGTDAKKVPSWRDVPLHKVEAMLKVEHDEFPYLRIIVTTVPSFGW
jgi:hypothetical protein